MQSFSILRNGFLSNFAIGFQKFLFSKKGQKVKVFYLQKYEKHKFLHVLEG